MVALESLLEKKLNPMSLLAKMKIMPSGVNKFNAYVSRAFLSWFLHVTRADQCECGANSEAELKDDLADHPCAAAHKKERNWIIEVRHVPE